jgi:hypothetical protein
VSELSDAVDALAVTVNDREPIPWSSVSMNGC